MHLRARIIAPIADTFGTKLTRAPRERRTSTGVRDHRHSLPVVVAATLATVPAKIAAIAHTFGFRSLAPGTRSSWIPPVPTTAGRQPLLRSTHNAQPGAPVPVSRQAERAVGHALLGGKYGLGEDGSRQESCSHARFRSRLIGPEAVLHLKSAARDGRLKTAPQSRAIQARPKDLDEGDQG